MREEEEARDRKRREGMGRERGEKGWDGMEWGRKRLKSSKYHIIKDSSYPL